MDVHRALAPAKVNLGLFLGRSRADGLHELASVMQSLSLADELTLERAPEGAGADQVVCPEVPGPAGENLAAAALRAFRDETGWDAPPLRLSILKRIPLAGGLGGGSADAAAALRLASVASGLGDGDLLRRLGARVGADVPAQVAPGCWLAAGTGERLRPLPCLAPSIGVLLLPSPAGLSTGTVYTEADRLGLGRSRSELEDRHRALLDRWTAGAVPGEPATRELLHNDLQQAAVSLCPRIAEVLSQARGAGADAALVSGSGPTVVALFAPGGPEREGSPTRRLSSQAEPASAAPPPGDGLARARRAARSLGGRVPAPVCVHPVDAAFGRVRTAAGARPRAG